MLSLIRLLLLGWCSCWLATEVTSVVIAQELPPVNRDIPWRRDVAAGGLTNPGRSRLLPADNDGTAEPAARLGQRPEPLPAVGSRQPSGRQQPATIPTAASGAAKWWNEEAEASAVTPGADPNSRSVSPKGEIIKSTQILSTVGNEPILAADMLGRINELLEPYADKATEAQLEEQRWMLMQRMMPSLIEAKLVYLDFMRNMDPQQLVQIRSNVYKQFDEKQLPTLVEQSKMQSIAELDERFRSFGTSLDSTRRSFFEQVAAREMIRRETEEDEEITHDELLQYYREHQDEYAFPAKARWEQLSALFDKTDSKREAYAKAAKMGNAVLRGAPLDVVARKESDALNADQGGLHDWTTRGSLVSEVLDNVLFTLPENQLSRILEDEQGFHIVRVVERTPAGFVPFKEAQVEIREKIKQLKRDARVKEYLDRLKRDTYVWNYFDQPSTQTANEGTEALRR